jgi:hypothetical protein
MHMHYVYVMLSHYLQLMLDTTTLKQIMEDSVVKIIRD